MKPIVLATTDKNPTAYELRSRVLSREAAAEGFVLLENDGILPLKENRVALYGAGARMTVKGGTGSGQVRERYSVSIAEGLANAGLTVTTTSWLDRFDKFYSDTYESYSHRCKRSEFVTLALEKESCRKSHEGICDEVRCITELGHEVCGSELSLCDNTHWVLKSCHERNHCKKEEHDSDCQNIAFVFVHCFCVLCVNNF